MTVPRGARRRRAWRHLVPTPHYMIASKAKQSRARRDWFVAPLVAIVVASERRPLDPRATQSRVAPPSIVPCRTRQVWGVVQPLVRRYSHRRRATNVGFRGSEHREKADRSGCGSNRRRAVPKAASPGLLGETPDVMISECNAGTGIRRHRGARGRRVDPAEQVSRNAEAARHGTRHRPMHGHTDQSDAAPSPQTEEPT